MRIEQPSIEDGRKLLKINGRHDWIRTNDLFRVKQHITFTFNYLTARGMPPKHLYSRARHPGFG